MVDDRNGLVHKEGDVLGPKFGMYMRGELRSHKESVIAEVAVC